MSISAAHLRELTAMGIVGDNLCRVVEVFEEASRIVTLSSRDASRSVTLDQDRVRAQNYRNRKKIQQVAKANDVATETAFVTQSTVTRHVTPPLRATVVSSSLLTSLEDSLESKSSGIRPRARGTRLEPGAPLTDERRVLILAEGISDPEKLWAEFVDYWSDIPGQRGMKIRWDGTLRNRCRDVMKRGQNFNGKPKSAIIQAADDLCRKIASFDGPPRDLDELRGAAGQAPPRLLSHGRG